MLFYKLYSWCKISYQVQRTSEGPKWEIAVERVAVSVGCQMDIFPQGIYFERYERIVSISSVKFSKNVTLLNDAE